MKYLLLISSVTLLAFSPLFAKRSDKKKDETPVAVEEISDTAKAKLEDEVAKTTKKAAKEVKKSSKKVEKTVNNAEKKVVKTEAKAEKKVLKTEAKATKNSAAKVEKTEAKAEAKVGKTVAKAEDKVIKTVAKSETKINKTESKGKTREDLPATKKAATPAPQKAEEKKAPAKPAAKKTTKDGNITLSTFEICRSVENRTPLGSSDSFGSDVGKLYAFTHVTGVKDTAQLKHIWYLNGRAIGGKELTIKSSSWRTWSMKAVTPEMTGAWKVEVVNLSDNSVIDSKEFTVK